MNAPTPVRIVVADDEPLARERVRAMLDGRPGYTIVGEAGDGAEAVDLILREHPDLVFLDVRMPELDGFEVLAALDAEPETPVPAIVFVTAFSDFAVKAFEVRALDYLLKPFDRERFDRALENASARRNTTPVGEEPAIGAELRAFLETLREQHRRPRRFLVRSGSRMHFVRADEIDWADAAGNYVRVHAGGRTHFVRDTMKAFEAKLDPARFVRVHRSALVNIDRVAQIEPYAHGEYVLTLRDGTKLTSSRAHGGRLRALLEE
jgi:two-component system LytT family response regulator